jgi:hypothetical protein
MAKLQRRVHALHVPHEVQRVLAYVGAVRRDDSSPLRRGDDTSTTAKYLLPLQATETYPMEAAPAAMKLTGQCLSETGPKSSPLEYWS